MTDLERAHDLRSALPPMYQNDLGVLESFIASTEDIVLDCEWDSTTGAMTRIGIGSEFESVQFTRLFPDPEALTTALVELGTKRRLIYQNADADLRKLREHGVAMDIWAPLDDTMLAHAVLQSELPHTLEFLSMEHGRLYPYKHLRDSAEDVYNACDLLETLYVWQYLRTRLTAEPTAERTYREERLPKVPYIILDEERGLRVNKAYAIAYRATLAERREEATKIVRAYAGWPLNLNSPAQLKVQAYDMSGFPVQIAKHANDSDSRTFDKDALATLRRLLGTEWDAAVPPTHESAWATVLGGGHPLLESRYLHFGAQQTISHYVDPCLVVRDGIVIEARERIYPETRQHVQASGRDSYVGPAMQQLRGESELLVCPDEGMVWVGFDWSNIETWLLGAEASDDKILAAKAEGWDTHTVNYCTISGTPLPPDLTKAVHTSPECASWRAAIGWQGEDDSRRQFTKRYIYRLHYRGKAEHAADIPGAKALGFDGPRLVAASEAYLAEHPALVAYWQKLEAQIDKYGVVYTFLGTPRALTSDYAAARYREGCNHPMQGGVANIYNRTRLRLHRAMPWAAFMYGKHDSQWWQVPVAMEQVSLDVMRPIVEATWTVNGRDMAFPASFKTRRA